MTTFQDLQAEHEALLNRHEAPADPAQFWTDVQHFIDRIRVDAEHIPAPRERDQLRAILRFWASYVFDKTGTYPDTTLRPAMNREASVPSTKPSTPTPTPPPPHRAPAVWGIAALAVLAILVAVLTLVMIGGPSAPVPSATSEPALPDRVATQAAEQMMVNAAMTEVVATVSTPTHAPTDTLVPTNTAAPTNTPLPTRTPTRAPMATPTPVIVIPGTSRTPLPTQTSIPMSSGTRVPTTPEVVVPPEQVTPLNIGYQILTQGPSPFDTTVWVIQLRLVGIGGNGSYIYWVDGRQLPGAEYTVQGKSCEPQAVALGVTSNGQAIKRDVTLKSPLAACLKVNPR